MSEISADARAIVDAVQDLTRVTIALHGKFASQSDAVRQLAELSIPAARIAVILSMPAGDVRSALAKARKREAAATSGLNQNASRDSRSAGQTGAKGAAKSRGTKSHAATVSEETL